MYLFFQIFQCSDVEKKDYWSESDIFCKITFQHVSKYTEVVPDCANPKWDGDATFIFPYDPDEESLIKVEVLDSDGFRSEILKTVYFDLSNLEWHNKHITKERITVKYSKVHLCSDMDIKEFRTQTINEVANRIKAMTLINL